MISEQYPSNFAEQSDESKDSSTNYLDRVSLCTLRINNPEIQTKYREYQQKKIADHPYLFIGVNVALLLCCLGLFIFYKFVEPRFKSLEADPIKLRENLERI